MMLIAYFVSQCHLELYSALDETVYKLINFLFIKMNHRDLHYLGYSS